MAVDADGQDIVIVMLADMMREVDAVAIGHDMVSAQVFADSANNAAVVPFLQEESLTNEALSFGLEGQGNGLRIGGRGGSEVTGEVPVSLIFAATEHKLAGRGVNLIVAVDITFCRVGTEHVILGVA